MIETIHVRAPSRLHFGLFGGAEADGRSFGGVGVMIDRPGLELQLTPNASDDNPPLRGSDTGDGFRQTESGTICRGPQHDRVAEFASRWESSLDCLDAVNPGVELRLLKVPESHIGLGTGTQIALSVSAALFQHHFQEMPPVETLARSVGRGRRSAVGTFGFQHGGLIVDRGKRLGESLSKLDLHVPFPEDWRFVLIRTRSQPGLSGADEEAVFANDSRSRSPEAGLRKSLVQIAKERLVPAVLHENFSDFSQSVFEYGKTSGEIFAAVQGGPFNGPRISSWIEFLRGQGVAGVGQSSWGPTIYAVVPSEFEANQLATDLSHRLELNESIDVGQPNNIGGQVTVQTKSVANASNADR